MLRLFLSYVFALVLTSTHLLSAQESEPPTDFAHDVLPILRARCAGCHTNGNYKGGLSMDTRGKLLDSETVAPGKSADSEFIARLTSDDDELRMPKGGQLSKEEIQLLTKMG